MTEQRQPLHSGGCQCGAVRYALYGEPYNSHICHCRMCQKAFGNAFAALSCVKLPDFAWTKGAPAFFASSPVAARGFCADCGTPLTYQAEGSDRINFSIGSLDDPTIAPPDQQIGIESRMPWFADLPALPASTTEEAIPAERLAKIESRQHPDGDPGA